MKYIIIALTLLAISVFCGVALDRSEQSECLRWQQQAIDYYPGFYLTRNEADQCAAHNIRIEAPIR